MSQTQQAVIVRGFDGATGYIGVVRLSIPSNLVRRHGTNHVVAVVVGEATNGGQTIVTPLGLENSHIQVNLADVVEMEVAG